MFIKNINRSKVDLYKKTLELYQISNPDTTIHIIDDAWSKSLDTKLELKGYSSIHTKRKEDLQIFFNMFEVLSEWVAKLIVVSEFKDTDLSEKKTEKTQKEPLKLLPSEKSKAVRLSRKHFGKVNFNGYIRYLINKEKE